MNEITLTVLCVAALLACVAVALMAFIRRASHPPKAATTDEKAAYPCVTVWLTRNGDEETDARILAMLAAHRDGRSDDR